MKGLKPDFHNAMQGDKAIDLYNLFLLRVRSEYAKFAKCDMAEAEKLVQPGAFGEHMTIDSQADGPVTLVIESVKDPKAVQKLEKQKAREAKNAQAKLDKQAKKEEVVKEEVGEKEEEKTEEKPEEKAEEKAESKEQTQD